MKKIIFSIVSVFIIFSTNIGYAQQDSIKTKKILPRPPIYGIPAKTLPQGKFIYRSYFTFTNYSQMYSATKEKMIDLPSGMDFQNYSYTPKLRYGLTKRLTLIANFPLYYKQLKNGTITKKGVTMRIKIKINNEEKEFEKLVGVPYAQLDQKLKMLIDREKINGKNYISLNPMGMVFVQAVDIKAYTYELPQSDVPIEKRLQYSTKESNSIKFLEKHKANIMKIITADFVTRVIVSGYSSKYDKPGVRVKQAGNIIKVSYSAKGGTLHMKVQTTARNNDELGIAVKKLQDFMLQ